jgi:hypothetical protein
MRAEGLFFCQVGINDNLERGTVGGGFFVFAKKKNKMATWDGNC